jgi:AcrR family transcriptional regulator
LSKPPQPRPRKRLSAEARRETIELAATEVFAQRGYEGASIDEIARLAGVSAPILYDHFDSKQDLYRRLLERHFADLRAVWRAHMPGQEPQEQRISRAFDAWFQYVESHPFAWRMLFRDTTGDPAVGAIREQVAAESRASILPMVFEEPGSEHIADAAGASSTEPTDAMELAWEVLRSVLQGLALWWYEHQHVPRSQIVATAMNAIWMGFERVRRGEVWTPSGTSGGS